MSKYIVSSSPHISSKSTTQKLMLDVIIALVPTVIASVVLDGFYPLFLLILSVGTAVFSEWAFNTITKRPNSTRDLSAIVTGMIFALCLPPVVPFYVAIVGAAFAIIIVKMLFGGVGKIRALVSLTEADLGGKGDFSDGHIAPCRGADLQQSDVSVQSCSQLRQPLEVKLDIFRVVIILCNLLQRKSQRLQRTDGADLGQIVRRVIAVTAFLVLDCGGQKSHVLINEQSLAGNTQDLGHLSDAKQVVCVLFHSKNLKKTKKFKK